MQRRIWLALLLCALIAGCSDAPDPPAARGELWPEADALFHGDARFIGGDGAFSVDLGSGRVLWLFGDSFIASTPERVRAQSKMIRNCVAIQTGYDPSRAFLRYYWRLEDGDPASFLPEGEHTWFWPMHGIRLGDSLLVFYEELRAPQGNPTGFETTAWTAVRISNPDDEPTLWQLEPVILPARSFEIALGEAALDEGGWLYVYGTRGQLHDVYLARFDRERAGAGDLSSPEWWNGERFDSGAEPAPAVEWGQPELSVHLDRHVGRYLMVFTEGYGATTLALRAADRLEGPWSSPRDILRPPESFHGDAFDYAGKAHPELEGADLVATYVPSLFDDAPVELEHAYYYPRFVRVTF